MMPIPPDAKINSIPTVLKKHNGVLHALVRTDDPAVKCQKIGDLVRNLKTTIEIAGLMEHPINAAMRDPSLRAFLNYQILGANKAWNYYTSGTPQGIGKGVEIANTVLGEIMFLIYDPRFTTEDAGGLFNHERGGTK